MAVRQQFTGDATQLNRELERTQQQYARLEDQLRRLQEQSGEAARRNQEGNQSWIDSLDDLEAGYALVERAVGLVVNQLESAIEKQRQLQRESLTEVERLGAAQADLAITGGFRPGELEPFTQQIAGVQARTQFPDITQLTEATTAAISAIGSENRVLALQAVESAAQLGRIGEAGATETLAGAALDISGRIPGVTPQESLGFLTTALGQARQTRIADLGQTLPRALTAGLQQFPEVDPRQVAAETTGVFTQLTQLLQDPEGARAAVATAALLQRTGIPFEGGAVEDPGTVLGRLQAIGADPRLREEFRESLRIGETRPVFEALGREGRIADDLVRRIEELQFGPQAIARFEQVAEQVAGGTPAIRAATERAAQRGRQQRALVGAVGLTLDELAERELETAEAEAFADAGLAERFFRIPGDILTEINAVRLGRPEAVRRRLQAELRRARDEVFDPTTGRFVPTPDTEVTTAEEARRIEIFTNALENLNRMQEQAAATAAQAQPQRHHEN